MTKSLDEILRPRLLLFLSVDMVNSSRHKRPSSGKNIQAWLIAVHNFFHDFQKDLRKNHGNESVGYPMSAWKMLGDEIIFVAEPRALRTIWPYVEAFVKTMNEWNELTRTSTDGSRLFVKGSAWLAGFPVANAVIDIGGGKEDYVGPSMDTGFRISKYSTPRKMMLSVDLAWVILQHEKDPPIQFDKRIEIKGVYEDVGYPCLWMETISSQYQQAESAFWGVRGKDWRRKMQILCEKFIEEHGVPDFCPFIKNDLSSKAPDSYLRLLEETRSCLRKEIYLEDGEPKKYADKMAVRKQSADLMRRISKFDPPSHST